MALLLCFTCLVALSLSPHSRTARLFANKFLMKMGEYSYCFYLLHSFVIVYVWDRPYINRAVASMLPFRASPNTVWVIIGMLEFGFNYVCCALSSKFFENPILSLKKHFKYKWKTPSVTQAADSTEAAPMADVA